MPLPAFCFGKGAIVDLRDQIRRTRVLITYGGGSEERPAYLAQSSGKR